VTISVRGGLFSPQPVIVFADEELEEDEIF
jgi:hypothetical protein